MRVIKGKGFIYRLGSGFLIGLGLVIPGVSGAVLAMVLGLYEPIIAAIAKPFTNWRDNLRLLVPLSIGMGCCLLFFSKLLEYLFVQYPLPTLYLFFGLVLGGLPTVVKMANRTGFRLSYVVSFSIGILFLMLITRLPGLIGCKSGVSFSSTLQGALIGIGLVVPGLSASFLLMAFGVYEKLLSAVAVLNFSVLAPLVWGFIPSIILVSQGITWLFQRAYGYTAYAILGLLVGSLFVVFPGWPRTLFEALFCFGLFCGGIWLSSLFSYKTGSV